MQKAKLHWNLFKFTLGEWKGAPLLVQTGFERETCGILYAGAQSSYWDSQRLMWEFSKQGKMIYIMPIKSYI